MYHRPNHGSYRSAMDANGDLLQEGGSDRKTKAIIILRGLKIA